MLTEIVTNKVVWGLMMEYLIEIFIVIRDDQDSGFSPELGPGFTTM